MKKYKITFRYHEKVVGSTTLFANDKKEAITKADEKLTKTKRWLLQCWTGYDETEVVEL